MPRRNKKNDLEEEEEEAAYTDAKHLSAEESGDDIFQN
jgi:hypothetical protein